MTHHWRLGKKVIHPLKPQNEGSAGIASGLVIHYLIWLVVWLPFLAFSQKYWEFHHPNWRTHIFQRGGPTTNQSFLFTDFPLEVIIAGVVLQSLLPPKESLLNPQAEGDTKKMWNSHGKKGKLSTFFMVGTIFSTTSKIGLQEDIPLYTWHCPKRFRWIATPGSANCWLQPRGLRRQVYHVARGHRGWRKNGAVPLCETASNGP